MHHTIYKITNNLNQKTYIGMHKTSNLDDGYMGSGKLIRRAISKYGLSNFTKEILFDFDNEEDMKAKEKELVVLGENSYNLCPGGHGGFGYINSRKIGYENRSAWGKQGASIWKEIAKKRAENKPTKLKYDRSLFSSGDLNPNYGKRTITNGLLTYKIDKNEELPEGFFYGEKLTKCVVCSKQIYNSATYCKRHVPRKHTKESKLKLSNTFSKTIWINDGLVDKRISSEIPIPTGFIRGRLKGGGKFKNNASIV